jgi:hypothetical protein
VTYLPVCPRDFFGQFHRPNFKVQGILDEPAVYSATTFRLRLAKSGAGIVNDPDFDRFLTVYWQWAPGENTHETVQNPRSDSGY